MPETPTRSFGSLPYRPCVGMMLFDRKGHVFVGKRMDQSGEAWQMPQGGIDEGEEPLAAAFRELKEEIGTDNAAMLREHKDWLTYDLPPSLLGRAWRGRYRGQIQKWFALRFLGRDSEINLVTPHQEFSDWKWVAITDLEPFIVPFKRQIYATVVGAFGDLAHPV